MVSRLRLLVGILIFIFPATGSTCDVCGCSISGQTIGILPKFHHHFFGFRASVQSFDSYHPPLLSTDIAGSSREIFYTTEIWSRFQVANRWQVFGFVPFSFISKRQDGTRFLNTGLGDVNVMALYSLLQNRVSGSGKYMQTLQLGGGIKMPTGKTDFLVKDEWTASLQNGTGTWDFFINTMYIGRWLANGFQVEVSYRKNTKQVSRDFLFGDRIGSSFRYFYSKQIKQATIMPLAGISVEYAGQNIHEGLINDLSGGYTINATAGIEFFSNRYGIGVHGTLPVKQSMSNGYLTSDGKIQTHFTYFF